VFYCFSEGNYATLTVEPEKKKVNVSRLLREFFNRYYLAQRMSLAILSKGVYVSQFTHLQ